MSRLSDPERAALIAAAIGHLRKAYAALKAAGAPHALQRVARASTAATEAYTLASGRQSPDVRCVHGTLLSRSCAACAASTERHPT